MNWKLIDGSLNDTGKVKETVLKNRGIKDWKNYIDLDESCVHGYELLDNIDRAVECMKKHIEADDGIHIVVDSDVDGYGSASMVYRYLKSVYPYLEITYSIHTKKQHGLSEDIEIPQDCNLVIIPDAGSNDVEQCKELSDSGVDVIILDHHICDKKNDYAIVVNNQMCDYPNKNFSGAGIVYKFLQALDDELWSSEADNFLDICALCNISDVMDMREPETKYYVQKGLNKIRSKMLKAMIEKQSYSMNGVVNITSIQFYITPILNACIRVCSQQDKEILFRAFIEDESEIFEYQKRGSTEITEETIYERAARLCSNAKSRQTKEVQKGVEAIENEIMRIGADSHKVLFVNASDIINETLTGLAAIKIAEKYNKPCLLLRRRKMEVDGNLYYGGSCRNFDYSPIDSLKDFLTDTQLFEFVQGHDNAAGFSIVRSNVQKAIETCDKALDGVSFVKIYRCDFDIDAEEANVSFIMSIDGMKDLFGQGVKEPVIHVTDIPVYKNETFVMGKNLDCWNVKLNDEISVVKFSVDKQEDPIIVVYGEESCDGFDDGFGEDKLLGYMDIIGTANINSYKGTLTPQIIVKDYEFRPV